MDVSYVARVPLLGTDRRALRFPPGTHLQVPTLVIDELAAGKFTALCQRTAARDAFDAAGLLELLPDLVRRPLFRVCFACSVAAGREDARRLHHRRPMPSSRDIEREVHPLLRRHPDLVSRSPADLARWIEQRLPRALEHLLDWSAGELEFLDRLLDHGEVDAGVASRRPAPPAPDTPSADAPLEGPERPQAPRSRECGRTSRRELSTAPPAGASAGVVVAAWPRSPTPVRHRELSGRRGRCWATGRPPSPSPASSGPGPVSRCSPGTPARPTGSRPGSCSSLRSRGHRPLSRPPSGGAGPMGDPGAPGAARRAQHNAI